MGLLSGGAARLFSQVLSPLYLPAVVRKLTVAYDERGDMSRTQASYPCRAQVDAATEAMRSEPGYTATDRAIFVLADTLEIPLDTGCEITISEGPYAGSKWQVSAPIDRDPAGAYWRGRGVLKNG